VFRGANPEYAIVYLGCAFTGAGTPARAHIVRTRNRALCVRFERPGTKLEGEHTKRCYHTQPALGFAPMAGGSDGADVLRPDRERQVALGQHHLGP
jgi:hypothetical protein